MGVLFARVGNSWVPVTPAVPDEVWVGPNTPPDILTELWYDTDEPPSGQLKVKIGAAWVAAAASGGSGTGTDEVWVGPIDPIGANPTIELWFDPDAPIPDAPVVDEVWVGPDAPTGAQELWYDTDDAKLLVLVSGTWTQITTGGGAVAGASYVYNQGSPAATWVITHNLGIRPNVTIEDSAGTTVEGEIVYDSINQLTLTFSAAFSGVAYLS